jgi:1-deoxy-D-xylulose-5-phosphate synthase
MAPKDELELRNMFHTALQYDEGPVAIRYPRGAGTGVDTSVPVQVLPIGKSETLRKGDEVALLAVGSMVPVAMQAANRLHELGHSARVVNARFVKPLDEALILEIAESGMGIVTIEENAIAGGFGSAVLEFLASQGLHAPVTALGVPDRFFDQASQARLRDLAGLGVDSIVKAAMAHINATSTESVPAEPATGS